MFWCAAKGTGSSGLLALTGLSHLGYSRGTMTTWVIISWVFVAILTAVNVFVFLKLKKASEQMMKMAFPGSKNMNEAMSQMQKMMSGGGGMPPNLGALMGQMNNPQMQAQMKAAMDMLAKMQQGSKRR
jgi:hypothetical protein